MLIKVLICIVLLVGSCKPAGLPRKVEAPVKFTGDRESPWYKELVADALRGIQRRQALEKFEKCYKEKYKEK